MNKQKIMDLMARADRMWFPRHYNKTVVCLFDEPSPTLWSFQAAAMKLGCQVLTLPEDHAEAAQAYGDLTIYNPETQDREMDRLAELYALFRELRVRMIELDSAERDILHVTFIGYSRSVQPFVHLLNHFPKIECHYVTRSQIEPEVLEQTDVFYVSLPQEGEVTKIDKEFLKATKHTSIVMRTYPYESKVLHNPRCIYSTQHVYGLYLRMAILDQSLSKLSWPSLYESYWMAVDKVSQFAIHYISKGWSMFTGSPLVSTGV